METEKNKERIRKRNIRLFTRLALGLGKRALIFIIKCLIFALVFKYYGR